MTTALSPRSRRLVRWAALPVAVVASGVIVSTASYAAFTSSTDNPGNAWSAGSIALTMTTPAPPCSPRSDLQPGSTGENCIAVTSDGSLSSDIRSSGQRGADAGPRPVPQLECARRRRRRTGPARTSSPRRRARTVYSGTLASLVAHCGRPRLGTRLVGVRRRRRGARLQGHVHAVPGCAEHRPGRHGGGRPRLGGSHLLGDSGALVPLTGAPRPACPRPPRPSGSSHGTVIRSAGASCRPSSWSSPSVRASSRCSRCASCMGRCAEARGWVPTTVASGSMEPRIRTGDVVVSMPIDGADAAAGQVVLVRTGRGRRAAPAPRRRAGGGGTPPEG